MELHIRGISIQLSVPCHVTIVIAIYALGSVCKWTAVVPQHLLHFGNPVLVKAAMDVKEVKTCMTLIPMVLLLLTDSDTETMTVCHAVVLLRSLTWVVSIKTPCMHSYGKI